MTGPGRRQMPEHIRGAIDAISRRLEPTRRLASMQVVVTPSRAPARVAASCDWMLPSDGRPALLVSRRSH